MSLRWLLSGTSVTLALVSIGTLIVSCSDDSSTGGCSGACSRSWSLCKDDLTTSSETEFQSTCLDACRSAASSDARELGQSLNCVTQAKACDGARQCQTFGPLLGFPAQGGFAGFGGSGGFGAVGAGGFTECQNLSVRGCSCFSGSTGVQRCQSGFWGACECTIGSGGAGGSGGMCSDICFYNSNGICDDGGPGSSTARCTWGTDCFDCGTRFGTGSGGTGGFGGSGGLGTGGGVPGCMDTCFYANNSQCEDGGPNSITSLCDLGTDCADCGVRYGTGGSAGTGGAGGSGGTGDAGVDAGSAFCSDTCAFAQNFVCDDGGPSATSARCAYGTDCYDCGARAYASNGAAGSPAVLCSNACASASDAVCDDDGVTCNRGTDCADCSIRAYTGGSLCTDACGSTNGVCEDGGFRSTASSCEIGTDCSDCGAR